jgi:hypothetical protein
MVLTVSRATLSPHKLLCSLGLVFAILHGEHTAAQSVAGFATRPISPSVPQPTPIQSDVAPEQIEQPAPPLAQPRPYSIIAQSQIDASSQDTQPAPVWNPANIQGVVAPPMVASGREPSARRAGSGAPVLRSQPYHRRALSRIVQDSGRGLTYDLPEALADTLPWVDRDRKNEPFEAVLARVANDLNRASLADPEWARGAQREIHALSKRLDRLPEPPPLPVQQVGLDGALMLDPFPNLETRPFRPRPIWPGASGRPETQMRPTTIVTETGLQQGPRATGVEGIFVPNPQEEGEVAPTPRTAPRAHAPRARAPRR